jgi:hypothetical protein
MYWIFALSSSATLRLESCKTAANQEEISLDWMIGLCEQRLDFVTPGVRDENH